MYADPLRKHDSAPVSDGAAAIVLAAGDRALDACDRPAWITGIAHRIDPLHLGARDLTTSPSTRRSAGGRRHAGVEVAELHAPFSHQELILRRELGLADDVTINPSAGALTANPMFTGGAEPDRRGGRRGSGTGSADAVLGHATSGPACSRTSSCVDGGNAR